MRERAFFRGLQHEGQIAPDRYSSLGHLAGKILYWKVAALGMVAKSLKVTGNDFAG